jgi:S1-C subfamily serine protease
MGIISAIGRADIGLANYEDFIQTDAAVNPGNSGGALVNLRGEVVGINTAIESMSGGNQGIAFAIPSNMARDVVSRLIADGRVVRGYLGVGIQDLEPGVASLLGLGDTPRGALVNHVEPGTPSAAAGLRTGDVIVAVDGEPVRDAAHLRRVVSMKGAKADVQLGLVREGAEQQVKASLTALPGTPEAVSAASDVGRADGLRGLRLGNTGGGVTVLDVIPGSDAWRQGIRTGDVIEQVNQRPARTSDELKNALASPQGALLLVRRGGQPRFVFLPPTR